MWLFEPNLLNLDIWWFEIGAPVELWGPPCIGGAKSTFKTSNSKHPRKNLALRAKFAKFKCLVIWNQGPGGTMRTPMRWGANSTFKTSNSKHSRILLALWAKYAKFRCLVIWIQGPSGTMRSPAGWGSNSTFKTLNSKHPQKIWLL
jgi:hypothetical protein